MSFTAAAAALALAAAAPLAARGRFTGHRALDLTSRGLAALAGVLLLFAGAPPAARPAAVLAFAAAALTPSALPCVVAAAAAVVTAVRPAPAPIPGFTAWPLVAALALALAAAALQAAAEDSRWPQRVGAAWEAALGGGILVLAMMSADGGRILRWRYGLGAGASRVELPGAALVLGLALLVSLAGALSMTVHLLTPSIHGSRAGLIGQRMLILGAGLGGLGVAFVAVQALGRSAESLAAGALELAAMVLAVGVLVLALLRLLAAPAIPGAAVAGARVDPGSERALLLAAAAALLAAATAGFEGWRAEGTYATTTMAAAAAAAILGLVAVQPTRLGLVRAALFVIGLLALLARAS
ncbi:MAG TPA: hypothetical protein VGN09_12490 [Vicinamibacteria bacterium]